MNLNYRRISNIFQLLPSNTSYSVLNNDWRLCWPENGVVALSRRTWEQTQSMRVSSAPPMQGSGFPEQFNFRSCTSFFRKWLYLSRAVNFQRCLQVPILMVTTIDGKSLKFD